MTIKFKPVNLKSLMRTELEVSVGLGAAGTLISHAAGSDTLAVAFGALSVMSAYLTTQLRH